MNRLMYFILFTPDIERMKRFYRDDLGFEPTSESPFFVSFNTGGASLALMAMHPQQKREKELCFDTGDIETDVAELRRRGVRFFDEIRDQPFGRVIHMRDPEGNLLSLLQAPVPASAGDGPPLSAVILNTGDMAAQTEFYRDRLGLKLVVDSPWWMEFDAGETRVALHPREDDAVIEKHHGQSVTFGFTSSDLDEWIEELRLRGVPIATEPTDRGFGRFADVRDPDGNEITLRDAPAPPTLEEKLAEEFESDDAPRRASIRKPVNKNSKAVSRLILKPEYRSGTRPASKAKKAAKAKGAGKAVVRKRAVKAVAAPARRKAASARGEGPSRTRLTPRNTRDPKRARARQATGHQKTAARKSLSRQKRAVARTSKSRPLKRAVSRTSKSRSVKRAVSRGGKRR